MSAITVDDPRELLKFIRAAKLRIDPMYRAECARLFDNAGIRLNYYSPRGLSIDELGEALGERFAHRRLDANEVLELLDRLFIEAVTARKTRPPRRVKLGRVQLDARIAKAQRLRQRLYRCDWCGQKARGCRTLELICGRCFPERGAELGGAVTDFLDEGARFIKAANLPRRRRQAIWN